MGDDDDDDDDGGIAGVTAAAQKANVCMEVSLTSKVAVQFVFGLGFGVGVDGLVRVNAETTPETGPKSRLAVLGVAVDLSLGAFGVLKPLSNRVVHSGVPSTPLSCLRLLLLVILPQKLRSFSLTGFLMESFRVKFIEEASEQIELSAASLPMKLDASIRDVNH